MSGKHDGGLGEMQVCQEEDSSFGRTPVNGREAYKCGTSGAAEEKRSKKHGLVGGLFRLKS